MHNETKQGQFTAGLFLHRCSLNTFKTIQIWQFFEDFEGNIAIIIFPSRTATFHPKLKAFVPKLTNKVSIHLCLFPMSFQQNFF